MPAKRHIHSEAKISLQPDLLQDTWLEHSAWMSKGPTLHVSLSDQDYAQAPAPWKETIYLSHLYVSAIKYSGKLKKPEIIGSDMANRS